MLLRPLRLILYVVLAFAAGTLWQAMRAQEACEAAGGQPVGGLCRGLER